MHFLARLARSVLRQGALPAFSSEATVTTTATPTVPAAGSSRARNVCVRWGGDRPLQRAMSVVADAFGILNG
jgi:hypothetical protein